MGLGGESLSSKAPDGFLAEPVRSKSGQSAIQYRSKMWKGWTVSKNLMIFLLGSQLFFWNGFILLFLIAYFAPVWLSTLFIGAYALHIFTSKGHYTGKWMSTSIRSWSGCAMLWEYFDMKIVLPDDMELDPKVPKIFGLHPHGVLPWSQVITLCTFRENPLYFRFPFLINKLRSTVASILFYIPLAREICLTFGRVDASRKNLERFLKKGNSLDIVVGGEQEVLLTENGKDILVLEGRKGFVRLALRYGAELVPTYNFHNNDVFYCDKGFLGGPRQWLKHNLKMSIPIFWGWKYTPMPVTSPLCTVFGKPIKVPQPKEVGGEVDEALVDEYHARYVKELAQLFEDYKHLAGYGEDRKLEIREAPEAKKARVQQKK